MQDKAKIYHRNLQYIILVLALLCVHTASFSQSKDRPTIVTPAIEQKINREIENETVLLKTKLSKDRRSPTTISFAVDTFRIEQCQQKYIDHDWSTAGMREATYTAAKRYDTLLNNYYQKLLAVLSDKDKAVLTAAQRSWIAFRDKELKLIGAMSKEEYSGGGTMQQLIDAAAYLDIIRQRTIAIFQHYARTQDF